MEWPSTYNVILKSLIDSQACKIRLFPFDFARISKKYIKHLVIFFLYLFFPEVMMKQKCFIKTRRSSWSELSHSPCPGVAPIYLTPPCPPDSISLHLNTTMLEQESSWEGLAFAPAMGPVFWSGWKSESQHTVITVLQIMCSYLRFLFYS